jgi:uncharacterized protein (DUF1697 family)
MTKYVAFLRGIGPGNPNMRNDKLRTVFEEIGFTNVRPVIASGNIIFEDDRIDVLAMETKIEQTILSRLGFSTTAIIRSQSQLQRLITANPFAARIHGPTSYLLVTFTKKPTKLNFELPYHPAGKPYQLIQIVDDTLFTVTNNTLVKTTDLMTWLEKELGKDISSRTWNTILRICKKF